MITVNIKVVKNLGNFESLHMEAGCVTPLKEGESFSKGFDRVYTAVEQSLQAKIAEAVEEIKQIGS